MSNDEGEILEAVVEPLSDEDMVDFEWCPCCESFNLLRLIARHPGAVLWIVCCGDCGKFIEKKWTLLH
jgi:hypothetical protein